MRLTEKVAIFTLGLGASALVGGLGFKIGKDTGFSEGWNVGFEQATPKYAFTTDIDGDKKNEV